MSKEKPKVSSTAKMNWYEGQINQCKTEIRALKHRKKQAASINEKCSLSWKIGEIEDTILKHRIRLAQLIIQYY